MDHKEFMDKLGFPKRGHQYIKGKEIRVYSDFTTLHFLAGEEGRARGWGLGLGSLSRIIYHTHVIFLKKHMKVQLKAREEQGKANTTTEVKGRQWGGGGRECKN